MRICAGCATEHLDHEMGRYIPPHILHEASPGWYCFNCLTECELCSVLFPTSELRYYEDHEEIGPGLFCLSCRTPWSRMPTTS